MSRTDPTDILSAVTFDARGLVPAIAQDSLDGEVRMVAWMNREALERTLSTGEAYFFSRSRDKLWKKGESSGNVLSVRAIYIDCDGDCVLLHVEPVGPSCHTGMPSCFYRRRSDDAWVDGQRPRAMMERLETVLDARRNDAAAKSYTRRLLDGGAALIGVKLREEADELARAIADESDERVVGEAADVVYHALVGLTLRGVSWRAVLRELARRFGTSGIDEKAARSKPATG